MRRLTYFARREDAGRRLDAVVKSWLDAALGRSLTKSLVRRLVMAGAIRLDGRVTPRPGMPVHAGARFDASLDEGRLPAPGPEPVPSVQVLYEDDAVIAVAKPPFLDVHATADPARPDLFSIVRRLVGGRSGIVLPYLGLHHRLDRDTSGVVLFTKSPAANPALARQFEEHSVEKVYHALTVGPETGRRRGSRPQVRREASSWRISNCLAQVGKGRESRVRSVASGGVRAETVFAILRRFQDATLVEARPVTGRKHQIRAHLSEQGMPILGDVRYGGPARLGPVDATRPMLHARALVLHHPVTGQLLRIECDYPDDFRKVLEALGR